MTRKQVVEFKGVLEASVIELNSSTRQRDAIFVEKSADGLDNRIQAIEREFSVRRLEAAFEQRREAQAALQRIQDGSYGICLDCEEPISAKRLAAQPSAARCIGCQEVADVHGQYCKVSFAIAA